MIKDKSIFIKNIYYMLCYAFTPLSQDGYDYVEKEQFENIHELFAAILSKGISRQLKQGLYREYVECREDVVTMRGKIDMQGTFRNYLERKRVLSCEFDELSVNNRMNQIIKTTVMLLLCCEDVKENYKSGLKKEMLFFSGVDNIDPGMIKWPAICFQRGNADYRMLISICQLVLEGMLITTDRGEYKLASFIKPDQMYQLYEKFIFQYFMKEHSEINTGASRISWALDDENHAMLPVMKSDITLSKGEKVLIIDAKYYMHATQTYYNVHKLHSEHLYQIFTYVKNKDAEFGDAPHEVSGMLLYAMTNEEIQPDSSYQMSGNRISVRTLDLSRRFPEIAAQLDHIVEEHF